MLNLSARASAHLSFSFSPSGRWGLSPKSGFIAFLSHLITFSRVLLSAALMWFKPWETSGRGCFSVTATAVTRHRREPTSARYRFRQSPLKTRSPYLVIFIGFPLKSAPLPVFPAQYYHRGINKISKCIHCFILLRRLLLPPESNLNDCVRASNSVQKQLSAASGLNFKKPFL